MIADPHAPLAERLKALTGLVPIKIASEPLSGDGRPVEVYPSGGRWGRIVGIRLFHEPREIVLRRVTRAAQLLVGPVDAAAYALEGALPPLDVHKDPATYRGELLRFVAVDWGVIASVEPLLIEAEPWALQQGLGLPVPPPSLEGYVVVEPEPSGSFPPGSGRPFSI